MAATSLFDEKRLRLIRQSLQSGRILDDDECPRLLMYCGRGAHCGRQEFDDCRSIKRSWRIGAYGPSGQDCLDRGGHLWGVGHEVLHRGQADAPKRSRSILRSARQPILTCINDGIALRLQCSKWKTPDRRSWLILGGNQNETHVESSACLAVGAYKFVEHLLGRVQPPMGDVVDARRGHGCHRECAPPPLRCAGATCSPTLRILSRRVFETSATRPPSARAADRHQARADGALR